MGHQGGRRGRPADPMAQVLPDERGRILVERPGDALIEFVARRRWGLRVAVGRRGIGHLPQRQAKWRGEQGGQAIEQLK